MSSAGCTPGDVTDRSAKLGKSSINTSRINPSAEVQHKESLQFVLDEPHDDSSDASDVLVSKSSNPKKRGKKMIQARVAESKV